MSDADAVLLLLLLLLPLRCCCCCHCAAAAVAAVAAVLLHDEPNGVQPAIAALAAQFREAVENVVHITYVLQTLNPKP